MRLFNAPGDENDGHTDYNEDEDDYWWRRWEVMWDKEGQRWHGFFTPLVVNMMVIVIMVAITMMRSSDDGGESAAVDLVKQVQGAISEGTKGFDNVFNTLGDEHDGHSD